MPEVCEPRTIGLHISHAQTQPPSSGGRVIRLEKLMAFLCAGIV